MRQKFTRWLSLLTVCFMLAAYCTTAQAALLDLGPTDVPSPTGHGFPGWYRDLNRVPLEPCLSQAVLPSGPACVLLADPGFNPALPVVFPTNFPSEMFYFIADSTINIPAGRIVYRAALEGAFGTSVAVGDRITFTRIRVVADLPVAGTYRITHPYGVETVVADAPGRRAIVFVRDIGIGTFAGPLKGDLGPWLIMSGFPQTTLSGESFIGSPNVPGTVTGSPFGTNFLRVEGPVGSNLDGLGNNFVQTNLFVVAGQLNTAALATPLTVDRATYTRDATNTQVEVFATTEPISNVRTNVDPNPFALLNIPSALQFSDVATGGPIPTTVMDTNIARDGKFFAASASFPNPATLPGTVRVTNIADVPPTALNVPLVDEVVISTATYTPAAKTLKVVAASGDRLAPLPTLSVTMKDGAQDVLLGTIANGSGQLLVTFPLTKTLPAPIGSKTYNIPPESITVTSTKGGSNTELIASPLNRPPVAVNDTAIVTPGLSVVIPVSTNDSDPDIGDAVVPASVTIVTPPASGVGAKGTALNNFNGTITYTALPGTSGTDTFTYTIADTFGAVSNVATVTVTIHSAPVVGALTVTTPEDTNAIVNVAGAATASLPATIVTGSVVVTVPPAHGTATPVGDGTVRYAPALNYNGPDSFSCTVKDTLGATSTPTAVTITVTPVADAPLTLPDLATTPQNTPVTINVLANDSHPDGLPKSINPATLAIVTNAPITAGSASVVAGQVLFSPVATFTGAASFTYTVSDNTTPVPLVSLPATVSVTVTPVNSLPVAVNDVASTFVGTPRIINVIANDTDADGTINPASIILGVLPPNVAAVASATGTVTFTATVAGTYTFTYTVKDNLGAVSNPATVTVSVASQITDAVSILRAQFTTNTSQWNVEGNTANLTTTPRTVTLRIGSDLTGQIIGTATVAPDGRWRFQANNTGVVANAANRTISASLPSGASRLAFPVAIK